MEHHQDSGYYRKMTDAAAWIILGCVLGIVGIVVVIFVYVI